MDKVMSRKGGRWLIAFFTDENGKKYSTGRPGDCFRDEGGKLYEVTSEGNIKRIGG